MKFSIGYYGFILLIISHVSLASSFTSTSTGEMTISSYTGKNAVGTVKKGTVCVEDGPDVIRCYHKGTKLRLTLGKNGRITRAKVIAPGKKTKKAKKR
jgi:hypothetical protein